MPKLGLEITSDLPISRLFANRYITTFDDACNFIKTLPYGRNKNKSDLATVFTDQCGTCSTKHALLKQLAIENNFHNVKLKLGLFKMNGVNTPAIANTLNRYNLSYIPEAHNYLKVDGVIVDCTKVNSKEEDFVDDLLSEIEIEPDQITAFKVNYHKELLKVWLLNNPEIKLDFDTLWAVRENCIADLSSGITC